MVERGSISNQIFNTAVLIDPEGELVGLHRKVHLWSSERRYFRPGNEFPVFRIKIGRVGIGICYDLDFPETARILALSGAQIVFFPSAYMKPYERQADVYVQSRAAENGIYVAFSNRIGREGQRLLRSQPNKLPDTSNLGPG
jgi:predicted amidohydrolase